jgi:hypothetical protein
MNLKKGDLVEIISEESSISGMRFFIDESKFYDFIYLGDPKSLALEQNVTLYKSPFKVGKDPKIFRYYEVSDLRVIQPNNEPTLLIN